MENLVATHIWEQLEEQTGISSDKLKNKEYLKALAYKKVNDATKDAESLVDELKKIEYQLGEPGAYRRAAKCIEDFIN